MPVARIGAYPESARRVRPAAGKEIGAVVGGLVAAAALLAGRRGIKGVLHLVWRGGEQH